MFQKLTLVLFVFISVLNKSIRFVNPFSQITKISSIPSILKYQKIKSSHCRPNCVLKLSTNEDISGASDGQSFQTPENKEAELLRLKARQLLAEANVAEASIREMKKVSKESLDAEADSLIHTFLNKYSETGGEEEDIFYIWMAKMLREKRLSLEKMKYLIDRILEQESIARGYGSVRISNPLPGQFNLADTRNSAVQDEERAKSLEKIVEVIIKAEAELDVERLKKREKSGKRLSAMERISSDDIFAPIIRSRVKETRMTELDALKRRLAVQVSQSFEKRDGGSMINVEQLTKETLNITDGSTLERNSSKYNFLLDLMSVPWVPSSLLGFFVACEDTISREDVKLFKSEILSGSRFYCTSSDSTIRAAIYRGNFLTRPYDTNNDNSTLSATSLGFQDVQERLNNYTGNLKDRYQMFLMEDPEWRAGADERYTEPKPVILLAPASLSPEQSDERGLKVFVAFSILATIATTFIYSLLAYALNPEFFNAIVNENNVAVATKCIPIFFGVIVLQSINHLAHTVVARVNNVKTGLPVPLPSLQIGTFGTITPLRSFPDTRSNLLDIALSGPFVTILISFVLILSGIHLTVNTPADILPTLPVLPVAVLKSSFLVGSLISFLAPKVILLPLSQLVPIHPLFLIGFTGLVSSALNLLPIGRLDGGRASTASFGRRSAYIISLLTLSVLAISALSGFSSISISWGLIIVLFQRQAEIPVRNEFAEINNVRFGAFITSLVLAGLILVPFPGGHAL